MVAVKAAVPFACWMVAEFREAMVDSMKILKASVTFCLSMFDGSSAFKDIVGAIFSRSFCSDLCSSSNALNDVVRIGGLGSVLLGSGKYMHLPLFRWFSQFFLTDFNT